MAIEPMNETPESPEERRQRRRARRWKRRARIAGPFLGLPLLVGTLVLSVDLITYSPVPEREKLTDRPLPESTAQPSSRVVIPNSVMSSAPVVTPPTPGTELDLELELGDDTAALPRSFAPPAKPYALR